MTVYRTRPLPRDTLRGQYQLAHNLIDDTMRALTAFFDAGRHEGGHEGLCYWSGREEPDLTTLEAVIVPSAQHGKHGVFVSEADFADVARRARAMGLGVLAQVHSHPGRDTRHSDGDDDLIVMPFQNMLSLVAPYYGRFLRTITDFSVHQYQDGRWVLCSRDSVSASIETAPRHD